MYDSVYIKWESLASSKSKKPVKKHNNGNKKWKRIQNQNVIKSKKINEKWIN